MLPSKPEEMAYRKEGMRGIPPTPSMGSRNAGGVKERRKGG